MDENRFEGFVSVHSETESEYRALSDGWTFLFLFSFSGTVASLSQWWGKPVSSVWL